MKIKQLSIKNFVGIDELDYNPSNINIFKGPKGSGKSSVLEAIEKAASNNGRRTELISHNETESTLFLRTDTDLEIDRRLRTDKADYLKLRQEGKAISSTEKELRKLLSGDLFKPLDFIEQDVKKQTEVILSMIKMDYSVDDIIQWFGEDVLNGINADKHILQVLKDVEVKFYNKRQEINRIINQLEIQASAIEKTLPDNYDGEAWKSKNLQEYYNKVAKAQEINSYIEKAKDLKAGFDEKIQSIKNNGENQKSKIELKYKDLESDNKDIIAIAEKKIDDCLNFIDSSADKLEIEVNKLAKQRDEEIAAIQEKYNQITSDRKLELDKEVQDQKDLIDIQKLKISSKQVELENLSEKKEFELQAIDVEVKSNIEKQELTIGKASKYLEENEVIDIVPLQAEADQVAEMKEYLREWEKMIDIRSGELASKKSYSSKLTNFIEIARNKPSELLKQHKLPIEGIGVDEKGRIRINGTLLDGLSDGEKLEAAFKIALQRIGELRVMCLDGFEKLNESEQVKIIKLCEDEDIQAFITITTDTEDSKFHISNEL